MSWQFAVYLILIHLLALPGAYMLLGCGLTFFLSSTTNVLTGETRPWARGMGWGFIGAAAVLVLWAASSILSCASAEEPTEHLALGNPSDAQPLAKGEIPNGANLLLLKDQYALSYNNETATANWVSWHLSKAWLGKADREDDFRADGALPPSWYRCSPKDYAASGFDRGHLCPSADRTKSAADNSLTFLMTNMVPQAPKLNRGTWKQLEDHSRKLVGEGNELWVVAGPHGAGGHGKNGYKSKLNKRVQVPSACWKVLLAVPADEDNADLAASRVRKTAQCIGAVMPNTQAVESGWETYQVSVRDVEELTGYDFFSLVDKKVQDIIEAKGGDQ